MKKSSRIASALGFACILFASALLASCAADSSRIAGIFDTTYAPGSGTGPADNPWVTSLAKQSDDKIIIGGYFTTDDGAAQGHFSRHLIDGALDKTAFLSGTGADQRVWSIAVQDDDKILIGGDFLNVNGSVRQKIARFNSDGSLDPTFNPGIWPNGAVMAIVVQSDKKILIGGAFHTVGASRNGIARLNADGTLDASFAPGTGTDLNVQCIALQPTGEILIGGAFINYNGVARQGVARLTATGALDTTFDPGTGIDTANHAALWPCVLGMALQVDGKVLIGGNFTKVNGVAQGYIARLNADGTLDSAFNAGGGGFTAHPRGVLAQSDGKILVCGNFWSYNGVGNNVGFVRLNANGSLDADFAPDTGPKGDMFGIVVQSSGKFVLGGWNAAIARYNP